MSKMKMMAAKELISEKRYDEARTILRAVDHPTATEWLEKLDKLDPPSTMQKILRAVLPQNTAKPKVVSPEKPVSPQLENQPIKAAVKAAEPIIETAEVDDEDESTSDDVSSGIYPVNEKRSGYPKAVAGEFDGIEFRSQLEIRFAAELKKRHVKYQYEPARIGKGKYMIDFYLPDHGIWVEVKGKMDARDEYSFQECAALLREEKSESLYVYSSDRKMHLVHDDQLEYLWPGKFWEMLEERQSEK